jgi:hypothetical protein
VLQTQPPSPDVTSTSPEAIPSNKADSTALGRAEELQVREDSELPLLQGPTTEGSHVDAVLTVKNPLVQVSAERQAKAWASVERLLRQDYVNPDIDAVMIICSCVAAHRLVEHPPVWTMCIAPSGSLKTAILQSLDGLPTVHFIDEVTPNTFVSGRIPEREEEEKGRRKRRDKEKREPASLLHRIGQDGFLIAADFSTILSMDERSRARILAQLRRIYDGHFSREFGTEENLDERSWKGRLTFITGATPDIDHHYSVFRSLGERFTQVRWPRAGGVEAGLKAMRQRKNAASDLKSSMHDLLLPILRQRSTPSPVFPPDYEARVAHLGEFIALARAHVPRSRSDHEPVASPNPEGNTRLPQEFAQIGRGAAVLAGRIEVNEEDFALVSRVAFDCIPADRNVVIRALRQGLSPYSTSQPSGLVSRTLEDLETLGIAERTGGNGSSHALTNIAQTLLAGTGATSPKMHMNDTVVSE